MNRLIKTYKVLKCKYKENPQRTNQDTKHTHTFFQIVYVASGSGYGILGERKHSLREGMFIFVHSNMPHCFYAVDESMTTYELKFDILNKSLFRMTESFDNIIEKASSELTQRVYEIINEAKVAKPFYEQYVSLLISQIILLLARENGEGEEQKPQPEEKAPIKEAVEFDAEMQKIKEYLESHYDKKISMKSIAGKFFLSESYIYKNFSRCYGVSPTKYICDLRLMRAKKLLETTEYTITEISDMLGFSSLHYFSRTFTSHEKISPVEYRETKKNGYVITINE